MLMLIGMLLEMLGISMVIPALALITQNNLSHQYPLLQIWLNYLGNPPSYQLVLLGTCIIAFFYLIRSLFFGMHAWLEAKFTFAVQANVSQRLFNNYLFQPYTFHLQHNSAQLIRNVIGEVDIFSNIIKSTLILIAEGMVFIGVTFLLLLIEPVGALLVLIIIGLGTWSIYKIIHNFLLRWGEARQFHDGLRVQHLQQALGGAKEVKLLGREDEFLLQFKTHNYRSAKVSELQAMVKALPRYWLEFLSVLGLLTLVVVMIQQGKPLNSIVPTLGVFAAAAFRVIPSVNRVLSNFQYIRFGLPVISMLYDQLCSNVDYTSKEDCRSSIEIQDTLKLESICFTYPLSSGSSLTDINISILCGSMTGFIGITGAGKSTLVDIILGLLMPDKGKVSVDDIDIHNNLRGWQNQIGYVPQNIYLTDDTLRKNIAFGIADEKINEDRVWNALVAAQLDSFIRELSLGLDTMVGERGVRLSGGQRQRIGIARALYHEPTVLVLDEATSSLDIETEHEVMNSINAMHGKKTILIVTHRLATVENCDQLYRLDQGKLVGVEQASANIDLNRSMH